MDTHRRVGLWCLTRINLIPKSRMDYDMPEGVLRLKLRADWLAMPYANGAWTAPGHSLRGPEYRWLKDHLALYGVETAVLAPGYPGAAKAAHYDRALPAVLHNWRTLFFKTVRHRRCVLCSR